MSAAERALQLQRGLSLTSASYCVVLLVSNDFRRYIMTKDAIDSVAFLNGFMSNKIIHRRTCTHFKNIMYSPKASHSVYI